MLRGCIKMQKTYHFVIPNQVCEGSQKHHLFGGFFTFVQNDMNIDCVT